MYPGLQYLLTSGNRNDQDKYNLSLTDIFYREDGSKADYFLDII